MPERDVAAVEVEPRARVAARGIPRPEPLDLGLAPPDAERDGVSFDDRRERAAARRGCDGVVGRPDREALLALEALPRERELRGVVVAERPRGRDDELGEDHDERA